MGFKKTIGKERCLLGGTRKILLSAMEQEGKHYTQTGRESTDLSPSEMTKKPQTIHEELSELTWSPARLSWHTKTKLHFCFLATGTCTAVKCNTSYYNSCLERLKVNLSKHS